MGQSRREGPKKRWKDCVRDETEAEGGELGGLTGRAKQKGVI